MASPEFVRELLLKLKYLESKVDEWVESANMDQIDHYEQSMEVNDKLLKLIVTTRKPPVQSSNSLYEQSFSDNGLYRRIKTIYEKDSETIEQTLENTGEEDGNCIPLVNECNNLDNWTTVLEFVSTRLDNFVLGKLRELYSVLEKVDLTQRDLVLSEISDLISTIVDYCEHNRETLLKLNELNNSLLSPIRLGNIGKASIKLSESTIVAEKLKGDD
jgi:hypothetical protein